MNDQVEEVKQKTDIVEIIGSRINLKKSGSNFKGICPFHEEKTPSFMVSPEIQIFKCFGCQKSGDVFTFLEEYEGMEFYESLKYLAEKAGTTLKELKLGSKSYKDRLFEVNSLVSRFYNYILLNHPAGKDALEYLTKTRGLKPDTIKKFELGYSPDVPLALNEFIIKKKKVLPKELVDAGILYQARSGLYDRFRGRVIFPLFDHRNNIVGFAGRLLPTNTNKDLAKYINTPETLIYKKSHVLYGLNEVRGDIKKTGFGVIVEGELDMISSYQAGIKNVVAIKGSALTLEQARLLGRFTKTITLALDADFAGNEAAKRGIFIAEKEGLQVKVAEIKGFKDPDEAARSDPKKLMEFIDAAIGVWDFLINFTFSKYKKLGGQEKEKIAKELIPLLAEIDNNITRSHYVSFLATRLGVPIEAVNGELRKTKISSSAKNIQILPAEKDENKSRRELLEDKLLGIMIRGSDLKIDKNLGKVLKTPFARKVYSELEKRRTNVKISEFVKNLPPELKVKLTDILLKDEQQVSGLDENKLAGELKNLVKEITKLDIKEKLKNVGSKIKEYEALGEKNKLKTEEKLFMELTAKLAELN